MVRISIKLLDGDSGLLDLMQALTTLRVAGVDMEVQISTGSKASKEPVTTVTPTIETVEPPVPVTPVVQTPVLTGRVVYRVIDPSIRVGDKPYQVRSLLLQHGPLSAQRLVELTGLGNKSIESSLWLLRNKGSIESVEVVAGQTVEQRKFKKSSIAAGIPISMALKAVTIPVAHVTVTPAVAPVTETVEESAAIITHWDHVKGK